MVGVRRKSGFVLIELMVVFLIVVIMGVLVAQSLGKRRDVAGTCAYHPGDCSVWDQQGNCIGWGRGRTECTCR